MSSDLTQTGYTFNHQTGIWVREGYAGIKYNDGDQIEQRIASIINNAKDLCVLSDELRPHCTDWPSTYHLSATRANILRPFQSGLCGDILEIGAGCGAITRYLGECGGNVLALEGTPRRAAIARSRTRDLDNVTVVCDKFDDFNNPKKFDVVTLIGVLEYANLFTTGENPTLSMLERVRSFLKPDGKLIIAIENQLGLKYFAGAPEDHLGVAMYGIEGRYRSDQPRTFGHKTITSLISKAGFTSCEVMAPFPDYKLPVSIVTERGFSCEEFDAAALACQSVRRDPQLPTIMAFSPELVWPTIANNGLAIDLSNSFLIVANLSAANEFVSPNTLAWHFTTDRRKELCKLAEFIKFESNKIDVCYQRIDPQASNPVVGSYLQNYLPSRDLYRRGKLLSLELSRIVARDGWTTNEVLDYLNKWFFYLKIIAEKQGKKITFTSSDALMPGSFFDITPQNIIEKEFPDFSVIDTEWVSNENLEIGYIVFRALRNFLHSVKRFGRPAKGDLRTYSDFISMVMESLGWSCSAGNIRLWMEAEYKIQSEIAGRPIDPNNEIKWINTELLPVTNLSQAVVERDAHIHNLNQVIAERDIHIHNLNQVVVERDAHIHNLNQVVAERDIHIHNLNQVVATIQNSRSWRYTAGIRKAANLVRPAVHALRKIKNSAKQSGGYANLITKAIRIVRGEGLQGIRLRWLGAQPAHSNIASEGQAVDRNDYQSWIKLYDTFDERAVESIKEEISGFRSHPKISVVMPVYNVPIDILRETIESVQAQLYPNWELCIADDASTDIKIKPLLESFAKSDDRIKVVFRTKNGHISAASNSALALASGDFVALLDNDDLLPTHALYHVTKAIFDNPEAALIYSDEDKINQSGIRYDPYFKCELNYELLLAQNMVSHLGVYRRELLEKIGGFRTDFEGAQDYDLTLRMIEIINANQVVHIPRVLYHWRAIPGSTALNAGEKNYAADAARRAISEHLQRTGRGGAVSAAPEAPALNRVRYPLPSPLPLVSIIIPTRDKADLLSMCLDSILQKTTYRKFEIIIVDNGSEDETTHQLFRQLPKNNVTVLRDDSPFNYAALNNAAVARCKGEIVCLLNNDIEIITPEWIEEMLSFAVQADIGCVGARLWYADGRLQHGGVITGIGGVAGHSHKYLNKSAQGYFGRALLHQSYSAVTGACLMVRKSIWSQTKGLDEGFAVAFNDVDFCLRVRELGYRNVWTPYAEMNHHESASRGLETTPEKQRRFFGEVKMMKKRWGHTLQSDPAYSRNLTLDHEDFSLAWPPRG